MSFVSSIYTSTGQLIEFHFFYSLLSNMSFVSSNIYFYRATDRTPCFLLVELLSNMSFTSSIYMTTGQLIEFHSFLHVELLTNTSFVSSIYTSAGQLIEFHYFYSLNCFQTCLSYHPYILLQGN